MTFIITVDAGDVTKGTGVPHFMGAVRDLDFVALAPYTGHDNGARSAAEHGASISTCDSIVVA